MKEFIYKIFGGKRSIQVIVIFAIFFSAFFLSLFLFIKEEFYNNVLIDDKKPLSKAISLCSLLINQEKKQIFNISLCVLNNMDKVLENGLVANPFPVDFVEIRGEDGKLIDNSGTSIKEEFINELLSEMLSDSADSDTIYLIPEPSGNLSIISVLPFNEDEKKGWLITGNNLTVDYIQKQILIDGFRLGIYLDNEKVAGDYKGLSNIPSEILDDVKNDEISFSSLNIDNFNYEAFIYPLKFRGDKHRGFLVGFIQGMSENSYENKFFDKIRIILFSGFLLVFLILFILTALVIAPLEKLTQKAKELMIKSEPEKGKSGRKKSSTATDLSDQFEKMVKDITAKEKRLQESHEELEQKKHQMEIVNIKLNKAQEELEGLDRMKAQFLSNVSHEFRTPVALIISFTELLLAEPDLNEEQKNIANDIYNSANRLKETVDNILALPASLEKEKEKKVVFVKPVQLIAKVKKNFNSEIENKKLDVQCDFSKSMPDTIHCKGEDLEHILNNLLSNAVKFTGENGLITIKVEITKHNPYGVKKDNKGIKESFLNISITDNGIGIKPEDQRKIFQKEFWQADGSSTREYEGSGLGLIITKKLVEGMDGTIWFYSKEGEGSTFGFVIPVEVH